MDTFGQTYFSGTAKSLVDKLKAKDITLADFLRECAYWALKDGFDEIRPLPLPTPPNTQAFNEFEALTPDRQQKVEQKYFYNNLEILKHYQQALFIKHHNRYNLQWLKELRDYIPQDDTPSLAKIEQKILEFKAWLNDNPVIVQKLKETFKAFEPPKVKRGFTTAGDVIAGFYE